MRCFRSKSLCKGSNDRRFCECKQLTSSRLFLGANEVGWLYTPTSSYALDGINTKFGFANNQTVTVEIYNGAPSSSTLLRSAIFTALSNQFSGGTFASLSLLAGQSYFIGFRNVGGLGVNFTNDAGATALAPLRYGFSNDGTYPFSFSGTPTLNPSCNLAKTAHLSQRLHFCRGLLR